jgi:hypothetical protein
LLRRNAVFLLALGHFCHPDNTLQKIQAASSGYAELMALSDEFVLERARVSDVSVRLDRLWERDEPS